jgi:hypothetical protein
MTKLTLASSLTSDTHDCVVTVYTSTDQLVSGLKTRCGEEDALAALVSSHAAVDKTFAKSVVLLPASSVAGGRVVLASTGSLNGDTDDVRKFAGI